MTKPKSTVPSIVVTSHFVIHVINGAQFVKVTCAGGADATVISRLTKI